MRRNRPLDTAIGMNLHHAMTIPRLDLDRVASQSRRVPRPK